jgi:hypothetical protein
MTPRPIAPRPPSSAASVPERRLLSSSRAIGRDRLPALLPHHRKKQPGPLPPIRLPPGVVPDPALHPRHRCAGDVFFRWRPKPAAAAGVTSIAGQGKVAAGACGKHPALPGAGGHPYAQPVLLQPIVMMPALPQAAVNRPVPYPAGAAWVWLGPPTFVVGPLPANTLAPLWPAMPRSAVAPVGAASNGSVARQRTREEERDGGHDVGEEEDEEDDGTLCPFLYPSPAPEPARPLRTQPELGQGPRRATRPEAVVPQPPALLVAAPKRGRAATGPSLPPATPTTPRIPEAAWPRHGTSGTPTSFALPPAHVRVAEAPPADARATRRPGSL